MGSQKTPRYQGTITSWKDEQVFGFIAPNGGGVNVFLHIKSLTGQKMRPADGLVVTYELTVNAQGKSRAKNVAFTPLFRQDLIAVDMPKKGKCLRMDSIGEQLRDMTVTRWADECPDAPPKASPVAPD